MPFIKVIIAYLVLTQSIKLILIRRLDNDEYVFNIIEEKLDPEYQFIELSEVLRVKDSYHIHSSVYTSHFRYFHAYLHDPETTPVEDNSFYMGFIYLHGRLDILPINERPQY